MEKEKIDRILNKYDGQFQGHLIGILHEVQNEFRYLPEDALRYISEKTTFPMTQIYSIANFFHRFSLKPKGEHEISVCLGTACHVKGGSELLKQARRDLKIQEGETTADMKFSLDIVRCIGACSLAPAAMVDGETHANMTPESLNQVVASLKGQAETKS